MNKFPRFNLKNIVEYGLVGAAIVLFGLFFYADFAIVFLGLFVLIPVTSIGTLFLTRRNIRCVIANTDLTMQKGDSESFQATLINDSIFPVTGMKILLRYSQNIRSCGEKVYRVSIGSRRDFVLSDRFTAWSFGMGFVAIEEIVLEDLFGFLNLQLDKGMLGEKTICSIRILPSIPIVSETNLLYPACTGGEGEERPGMAGQTAPGYEHRKYIPGDSIRKINWKLSAKKDEYMIRMDEETGSTGPLIWLERYVDMEYWHNRRKLPIFQEEQLVEGCLGCVRALLLAGMETTVLIPGPDGYQELKLYVPEDIGILQNAMASVTFQKDPELLTEPNEWNVYCRKKGPVLVFAVTLFGELQERLEQLSSDAVSMVMVTETSDHDVPQTLILTNEYSLKPLPS